MKRLESIEKEYQDLNLILVASCIGTFAARVYKLTPKAKYSDRKCLFAYTFKSEEELLKYLEDDLASRKRNIEAKKQYKLEKKAKAQNEVKEVKVGDIFHCSWGYEQTQCDFYQVTSKPSAATVIVKPIKIETVKETSWCSDRVKAVRDSFFGDEFKVRLNGKSFKISSFQYARKVENPDTETFHRSWGY